MGSDALTATALAARRGDREAAEAFVRATQQQVWRLLVHLADRRVAEDLTQETYLRAFAALPAFRARASARTWLLSIAHRVAADHLRLARRRPRTNSGEDWQGIAERAQPTVAAGPEDALALRQALAGLATQRREAFVLTQVLGLCYAEAAEVCGCPVGTIRSRVARARDDLVLALSDGHGGGAATTEG